MYEFDRRRFLHHLSIGAGVASGLGAREWIPGPTASSNRPDLETIRGRLTDCSREAALSEAVTLISKGATWQDLLGGTFLAGVHDIKPQPVGFQFHCVMMVESAFQLAEASTVEQRMLPVFFNIDDFKRSQVRDKQRGDWHLSPAEDKTSWRPSVARRELDKAFKDWDEKRADRAITSLFRSTKPSELFEQLWPLAARDFTNIGHKIIYTAHVHRTLSRIGWRNGLPVMRSLILGLMDGTGSDPAMKVFDGHQKLAADFPASWREAPSDPDASVVILQKLRTAAPGDAAGIVAEQIGRGCSAASVWDGYRLYAGEMLMHKPGILPVHPTTSINALYFAFRTTGRESTRLSLLLQGAYYLVVYRDFFAGRGTKAGQPGIDSMKSATEVVAVEDLIAQKDRSTAARGILALPGGESAKLAAAIRQVVFEKGTEHHLFKYTAAVLEDVGSCHPKVAPQLLAAGIHYIPSRGRPDAGVHRRAVEALGKRR